jgi:hypothetical protein
MMSSQDKATGTQFVRAAWATLRQDRSLITLPVVGSVLQLILLGLATAVTLFVPGILKQTVTCFVADANNYVCNTSGLIVTPLGWVLGAVLIYLLVLVTVFFSAAVVAGAQERLNGGDPTVVSALKAASSKFPAIAGWAAIETVVSAVIRWISDNFRFVGAIIAWLLGAGWSAFTYMAVPVMMFEDKNPVTTVRRSGELFIAKWGKVIRARIATGVIFGLVQVVLFLALIGGLVFATINSLDFATGQSGAMFVVGLAGAGIAFLGLLVTILLQSTLVSYIRVMLYRHATGQLVPGVEPAVMDAVFAQKKNLLSRQI